METGQKGNGTTKPSERYDVGHVQEVIRQAHDELRVLMQQRADVMKRIGTVKQTIAGLANLFGGAIVSARAWSRAFLAFFESSEDFRLQYIAPRDDEI